MLTKNHKTWKKSHRLIAFKIGRDSIRLDNVKRWLSNTTAMRRSCYLLYISVVLTLSSLRLYITSLEILLSLSKGSSFVPKD